MLPHAATLATIARTRPLDSKHLPAYLQRVSSFDEEPRSGGRV